MNIRKAATQDTAIVMGLLRDTAEWLQEKGSKQWADVLSGEDKHDLAGAVKRGDVYLFSIEEKIIGMAAIWNTPTMWDQELWKTNNATTNTFYIHRLIVHPNYRGKNYGSNIIETIKEAFSDKATELRLDCLASNKALLHFYNENGFESRGSIEERKGGKFELFSFKINN